MTPNQLNSAVAEAKRFIEKSSKAKVRTWTSINGKRYSAIESGSDCAAIKRASLDLTRALADMRKIP